MFKESKNLEDSFEYRKGYLDGLNDKKKNIEREINELIENGFIISFDDLKKYFKTK